MLGAEVAPSPGGHAHAFRLPRSCDPRKRRFPGAGSPIDPEPRSGSRAARSPDPVSMAPWRRVRASWKRILSRACRPRKNWSHALGLPVVMEATPRVPGGSATQPGTSLRRDVSPRRSTRSKIAALLDALSRTVKRYSSRAGSSARMSTTYVSPRRRIEARSRARAPVRRPTSRASGSSIRSTVSCPSCFSTSNIRLRVRTRNWFDCSSDVMSSPDRESSSFSPVSFVRVCDRHGGTITAL